MKILVISGKNSTTRREKMAQQMRALGLEFEFMDAVMGTPEMRSEPDYQAKFRKIFFGYDLNPGEIGCYKSHLQACARAIELNQPVLVLEDDVFIKPDLVNFLDKLEPEIYQHDFEILRLSGLHPKPQYKIKSGQFEFVRFFRHPSSMVGYIIKPNAAKKFITFAKHIYLPIDDTLDRDYIHGLKVYGYQPYLIEHDFSLQSEIGERRFKTKSLRLKLCKEPLKFWWAIRRFIYTRLNYFKDKFILNRFIPSSRI
jgi:glycosyl transferase family 25